MRYKLGIENLYGSLLDMKEFDNDNDMWNFILETNDKYVKTNDLVNPRFIVQVYKENEEVCFENCISQFTITSKENL